MSKCKIVVLATAFLYAVLSLCGCSNSIDTLIEDYNSNFKVATVQQSYTLDDVIAEDILRPYYAVSYTTTLCLTAPTGGVNYTWTAEVDENANDIPVGKQYILGANRVLSLYIRNSNIKRWGTYKLTVSITRTSGEIIKDTAWLYVY